MMKYVSCVLFGMMLLAGSCLKKNGSYNTCSYDACATKAPDSQVVKLKAYLDSNSITAVKHCSGLYYNIVTPGTGDSPNGCSAVLVTYRGNLTNGNVFDSTSSPVSFSLLTLIQGWANGVPLIKRGGEIMLYLPPALAYGQNGSGSIPGNAITVFDIKLLDWQ